MNKYSSGLSVHPLRTTHQQPTKLPGQPGHRLLQQLELSDEGFFQLIRSESREIDVSCFTLLVGFLKTFSEKQVTLQNWTHFVPDIDEFIKRRLSFLIHCYPAGRKIRVRAPAEPIHFCVEVHEIVIELMQRFMEIFKTALPVTAY